MLICTPYITLRNGRKLHASEKGLEAFCFEVTEEQYREYIKRKEKEKKKK